jgi:hypothetical protein
MKSIEPLIAVEDWFREGLFPNGVNDSNRAALHHASRVQCSNSIQLDLLLEIGFPTVLAEGKPTDLFVYWAHLIIADCAFTPRWEIELWIWNQASFLTHFLLTSFKPLTLYLLLLPIVLSEQNQCLMSEIEMYLTKSRIFSSILTILDSRLDRVSKGVSEDTCFTNLCSIDASYRFFSSAPHSSSN